jgi:hypothetical protein
MSSVTLSWYYPENAASYQLQVSSDSNFVTPLLANETGIIDTFKVIAGLVGQTTYYWRVKASNAGGASAFSPTGYFTAGFPATVSLDAPTNNLRDIPVQPTMVWRVARGASSYHLQVASTSLFDSVSLAVDVAGIVDTSRQIGPLEGDRFYFWRVRAANAIGTSNWSAVWRFKTAVGTAMAEANEPPAQFALHQNYPNPFNPITAIVFDLPNPGTPQLVIYDVLGREVLALVNAPMAAGRHQVQFDASPLPSGVYYYRLRFEGKVLTKRMTVVK